MRKTIIFRILYFSLGVVVVFSALKVFGPSLMILERESRHDFDTTVARVIENAKEKKWEVPKVYNFQKIFLKETAVDVGRLTVVELCQPSLAAGLLKEDVTKFVSVMMPAAIAVYEKADGRVYVAGMNLNLMGRLFGGNISRAMQGASHDHREILRFLAIPENDQGNMK